MTAAMEWQQALPLAVEILGIEDVERLLRFFTVIRHSQLPRE